MCEDYSTIIGALAGGICALLGIVTGFIIAAKRGWL